MERSAQQATVNVFTQVHEFSGLNLVRPLSTWDKCRSGNAPASCRAGTRGWRRADRGRGQAGTRGCHGAFSPATAPTGKVYHPPPRGHPGPRPRGCHPLSGHPAFLRVGVGAAPRPPASQGRLTPCRWKPSAPPAGCSALAPRPMATVSSGDGARDFDAYPGGPTGCPQHGLALSALDYPRLVTWAPGHAHPNSDALREQPAAPFPGTREPPTSGRDGRSQDPDLGISLCAAPRDPDSRAAGARR